MKMNELVVVDMSQYGLEETKAAEIRRDFDAVLKIAEELEGDVNNVVSDASDGITEEVCKKARAVRLKLVKVRTGIAQVHKERKAFFLSGGRAVDGLKNAYTHAVEGNEAKLKAIETHFENIEKERIEKLQRIRSEDLQEFEPDYIPENLGSMNDSVWLNYFNGVGLSYKQRKSAEAKAKAERKSAEAKAKADRIAEEKAEVEERERIAKENVRLKADADERERRETAERKAREATERQRLELEAKEKSEREAKAKAEQGKRDKLEADRLAKEEAERKRIEAERRKEREEAEAKLAAEREARKKVELEASKKAYADAKAKADAEARAKDVAHKQSVMFDATTCFVEMGIEKSVAGLVVELIADGKVKNILINY